MAREIPLIGGATALVSDCDYERLSKYKWRLMLVHRNRYAVRHVSANGKQKAILLHRDVMGSDSQDVDHHNADGLDNRRENLRPCSHRQNSMGQRKSLTPKTSKYKGVYMAERASGKNWKAQLKTGSLSFDLGNYETEEQAARQYDRLARVLFGRYARTNEQMATENNG